MSSPVVDRSSAALGPSPGSLGARGPSLRSLARRVAVCFALGAVLLAGKRALAPAEAAAPALVVEVAAGSDADAIRRAAIDAVLVDEALRARWPLADPVVRERLLDVMRTDGASTTDVARALAPNLPATDPATRARLAWIGRELIRARLPARAPTPAELATYQAAHPHRYAPGWLAFRQLTITRARHGAAAESAARDLLARVAANGRGSSTTVETAPRADDRPPSAPRLVAANREPDILGGDPTMLPAKMAGSPATVDARFGAGFAAQVATAPLDRWSGPYEGTFGYHVVWREAASAPTAGLDARVASDWAHDQREDDLRRAIDALVAQRRVLVREVAR